MDEVSQVIALECKGAYYLLKGSKEMLSYFIKSIRALADWNHERYLNKPGSCDWNKISEISNGNPCVIEIPKEMFDNTIPIKDDNGRVRYVSQFEQYCEKHNFRYCVLPDINPNDNYIPIAVPAQDAGFHSEAVKGCMNARIQAQEAKDMAYKEKLMAAQEELANARSDEDRIKAKEKVDNLTQAKDENASQMSHDKEVLDKGNVLTFEEYLMQGKGTTFEENPELALAEENIGGIINSFSAEECLSPIRDDGLVPDSNELFFVQEQEDGSMLQFVREFKKDEEGLTYSDYRVTNSANPGLVVTFSDKGLNGEEWDSRVKDALIQCKASGEKCMVFPNRTSFLQYEKFLRNFPKSNDITNDASLDLDNKVVQNASSPETVNFIKETREEAITEAGYLESLKDEMIISSSKVFNGLNGDFVVDVEGYGQFSDFELLSFNSETAHIKIKPGDSFTLVGDNETLTLDRKTLMDTIRSQSEAIFQELEQSAKLASGR